jgi:hypothetical protein
MGWLSDAVSVAAPIAGAYFGGPAGAQIGGMIGGALAGGQQVNQANQQLGQAAQMSQFRPVGVTTNFGTSKFGYDEQGRLNEAGYTLDPQLQGYQDQLAGMTGQGLTAGQGLMSLGQGYLGESPEAVRQRYMQQQNALLAPQNEQALAGIRNNLFQTGRGGLATGATEAGDMAATNPELAAYYNSLANQQRQIAAGAEQASQQQITFGQGLLTGAYDPFKAGLSTQQGVEGLGQGALDLGLRIGGQTTAGSTAAGNLLAQQQNPYTTAASSLLSNPQLIQGIGNWFSSPAPTSSAGAGPAGYFSNIDAVDTSSWM